MPYIYKITNRKNQKIYIGKTLLTPEARFKEHIKDHQKKEEENRPLYRAMKKYGVENFFIETVEECEEKDINEREKYWIEYYGSFKNGYNATIGGDGTRYADYDLIYSLYQEEKTIDEIKKITSHSEKTIRTALNVFNITKEERIERARKNLSKQVAMLNKDTEEILKVFMGTREAGRYLNKHHQHINEVCLGKRKSAYGYKWKYLEN